MANRYQIKSPCEESWDQMTPSGAGRHCDRCKKVVLDLTSCTEFEAIGRLRGGSPCVRLRIDAVGTPIFLGAALAGSMAMAPGCDRANSQASATTSGDSTAASSLPSSSTSSNSSSPSSSSTPTTPANSWIAAAPPASTAFLAGDIAIAVDQEMAASMAMNEAMEREKWSDSIAVDMTPFGRDWCAVVRRVLRYRSDGSPEFAKGDARVMRVTRTGEIRDYGPGLALSWKLLAEESTPAPGYGF